MRLGLPEARPKAAELNPTSGDPLYELAYCYKKTQQSQLALDNFNASREKLGDRIPVGYYLHVAECQLQLGKKSEACLNLQKAEQLGVEGAAQARKENCR
ncbi:MAG: tetratricopeptide repeat protein [Cyclobacteriaceae bacterium]|nr:tetratricopeptide repeat protein [Cyclobacteriaceae bacterium]